jgi:GT2 family glycosyltransferase
MKLAVGFITYQESSARYLADFLPSLEAALAFLDSGDYQVMVFDNSSSGDRSDAAILEVFSARQARQPLQYQTEGKNLGFSRAYNIMIRSALKMGAEYFFVINPDTLIEPDAIQKLIAALDTDASLASAAPKIRRWDFERKEKTGRLDSAGIILKAGLNFSDLGQGEEDRGRFDRADILGPSGAAALFRLSALAKVAEAGKDNVEVQYFDERFFMYKEDCDLAYRLFLAGYKSRLVPEALIYHDRTAASSGQGLSSAWSDRQRKSRQVRSWSFANQHLLFVKHWKKQNLASRLIIMARILIMFIFSLILEQFLLKSYWSVFKLSGGLTNIK